MCLYALSSICRYVLCNARLALPLAGLAASLSAAQPNIILIITDDQGYGDIAAHGNTMIRTPHLDRLHAQSVRFTNFHVDPTCSPTRAALLTGRYSTRAGVWHTVMGRSILFRDELTLPEILEANGYRNGIFGKWHLGENFPSRPQDRGFHHITVHGGGGIGQTPDYWGNDYFDDHYLVNGEWRPFRGYCTDVFFNEAISFMERSKGKPFFVYLATNAPHSPYRVPERYERHYLALGVPQPMATFYGMIENIDDNIGRLLEWLKTSGLEENTIVIFMSDNGTSAGVARPPSRPEDLEAPERWTGFNAVMRGMKGTVYEGGHRVPFFIRWPAGGIDGGRDVARLTAHIDLLPTLAELCGLKFAPRNPLDGRSLAPLIRDSNEPWPDRTLFVHTQREEIPPKWRASSAMTQRWRLVNGAELYDIKNDPGQSRDIAAEHPHVVRHLRDSYEAWWSGLQPSFTNYGYIVVGAPEEDPVHITCMDWHAPTVREIPWDQAQIRAMPAVNGWWMVDVAKAGQYEITLRHKPAKVDFPLEATLARVRLGGIEAAAPSPPGASSVTLNMELPAGPARLDTTLVDEASGVSRGAFFVEISRIAEDRLDEHRQTLRPKPGDVFREYTWTHQTGDAGGSLRVGGRFDYGGGPIPLPHHFDLDHAVKAEIIIEKLLCHEGTRGLAISINNNDWIPIPDPPGIPEPAWDYMHHTYPVVPICLSELRSSGGDQFRIRVSPEHPWNWPQNLIYGVHFRIYYDKTKKPHPTGSLISPRKGDALGTKVLLEAHASSPNGSIRQVDFLGHYEDVNLEGDGEYTQWHYHFHRAVLTNHIGSVTAAPWRWTWDTSWAPDQPKPFSLAARVTDETGLTCFTDAIDGLTFQRDGFSVELCKPYEVPKKWLTRAGEHQQKFRVKGDLSKAIAAQLIWVSWCPGYMEGLYLNDHRVLDREGPKYAYFAHRVSVKDLTALKPGENILRTGKTPLYDGKMVHGMELNWPGIMVLIQYRD
jgi:arylsulfatase A-like enzyme